MISNISLCCSCYKQYFNSNRYFYVEVKNECPDYINMILEYKINGKTVTKPSPTFAPGKTKLIVFPENASNIYLRIFDSAFRPPEIICTRLISPRSISRYKVIGPRYGDLQCISI